MTTKEKVYLDAVASLENLRWSLYFLALRMVFEAKRGQEERARQEREHRDFVEMTSRQRDLLMQRSCEGA